MRVLAAFFAAAAGLFPAVHGHAAVPLVLEVQVPRGVDGVTIRKDVANAMQGRFDVTEAAKDKTHRAVVMLRGARAYVRLLDPAGQRLGTRRIGEDELGRRPAGQWPDGTRKALGLAVVDAVTGMLASPARASSPRARGKKVDLQGVELDVTRGDADVLGLELEERLPTLAACLDQLKDPKTRRTLTVRVAWDPAGSCQGVRLDDLEEEAAVHQCLMRLGPAMAVDGDGEHSASATWTLRVDPAR